MAITKRAIGHSRLLEPNDHFTLLTKGVETTKHGAVLIGWQPLRKPKWFKTGLDRVRDQLTAYTNEPDIFLTPNQFHGWRLVRLLSSLTAFYVDIDDHTSRTPDMGRMRAEAQTVIDNCIGIPEPNFVVYTGRGIHLYWLTETIPAQALPRWRAVQRVLCDAFGGDRQATDPTRVLRMVGTINSKTGERVTGELIHANRYDFNLFCDDILPYSQTEIRDFRAAQARRDALRKEDGAAHRRALARYEQVGEQWAEAKAKSPNRGWSHISNRWHLVYQDALTIQNHFWFGGICEDGQRNYLLWLTANALSWFTASDALINEIKVTARIMTPSFSHAEVVNSCSSVIKRAQLSADTEDEHRYKFSRARLWKEFAPLVGDHPDLVQQLRAIIPDELHQERQIERQAKRDRVAEGRYRKGKSDFSKQKREVRKLVSQGFKTKHVAERIGVSLRHAQRLVKAVKK